MSSMAFHPRGNTKALNVTTTSSATPINFADSPNSHAFQFVNAGTKTCWVCAAQTAAGAVAVAPIDGTPANGIPILAGEIVVYVFGPSFYFAAITSGADTTTLYITPGEGL